ncbi:glycoside hydrolase family 47 protein [Aspergillus clavatus NRRL 1]|uniref:alpha-1,2-Mannosidase n=1 Tax=Aspergillus clavatus (strain ATCC 1007 / CBS 513.65 / DSM 816 / NCTC 3887 / NRRL 1 / QM 1276 / 107) TaxID=344612 RepID=A1CE69_ASPCL|nr:mannosyl-oligosaccharide alpha-1,2-mannosidase [Aspergillus clavatus NRRL 1]EAW11168.1 mannosyl-oligosaccharide alpha-1,2-mannosidase [Aspergillus clavatus NRRL 1]
MSRSPSQRLHNENQWRPNRNPNSNSNPSASPLGGYGLSQSAGASNKLGNFFDRDRALPMYKDKPYFAPRRTAVRSRQKRITYAGLCVFVLVCLWYYRSGSGSGEQRTRAADVPETHKGEELWKWVQSLGEPAAEPEGGQGQNVDWSARREKVRDAFIVSWDGYEKHGWGYDEYRPVTKEAKQMVSGGMGWIIVDALDTLMIMNLTSQVRHARNWIHNSLRYDQDHDVNTFETTIRMLGGLLSAHYLSTAHPELAPVANDDAGEDLYIEKATDLAERLMGAFESKTGVPYASINLNASAGIPAHSDDGASSTAEATTLQLEFKYLAKLTGEAEYWRVVEKVMQVVDDQKMEDGLLPIFIYPETGHFRGDNIRLGSRGDSYYEYLIKQYLQTAKQEPIYKDMWDESLMGIRKHLIAYTKHARLMILGEKPEGLEGYLSPKMDHLVCFMPGTIALGATGGLPLSEARKSPEWSVRQDEEILLARELMKTCWATYLATATGLAPEITYFKMDDPPLMFQDVYPDATTTTTTTTGSNRKSHGAGDDLPLKSAPLYPLSDKTLRWREDIEIHTQDRHNLQRPETVESLFYMYRVTGDEMYREWGWEMFKSFVQYTAVVEHDEAAATGDDGLDAPQTTPVDTNGAAAATPRPSRITGFTSLSDANTIPPVTRDNMESFWMAETLKYFYLLFSEREFIALEDHVFNTEAHPFPRFRPTGDLKTGWTRQPR